MNSLTAKRIEMLKEVKEFGIAHAASFTETSLGKQLFDSIGQIITELGSEGASQVSGRNSAHNIAAIKARIREDLREMLLTINRTARIMSVNSAEFEGKFRLPRNINDQKLLNAARAFVQDATPLKDNFIRHEMPADFLEQLTNLITAFDQAASQKTVAVSTHATARLTIEENVGRGMQTVRQLDAIIRNKFNGDPVVLSAWTRASHVARKNRKDDEEEAVTETPTIPSTPQ